jgi:hypothetical protein
MRRTTNNDTGVGRSAACTMFCEQPRVVYSETRIPSAAGAGKLHPFSRGQNAPPGGKVPRWTQMPPCEGDARVGAAEHWCKTPALSPSPGSVKPFTSSSNDARGSWSRDRHTNCDSVAAWRLNAEQTKYGFDGGETWNALQTLNLA